MNCLLDNTKELITSLSVVSSNGIVEMIFLNTFYTEVCG